MATILSDSLQDQDKRCQGSKTSTLLSWYWCERTSEKSYPVQKSMTMTFFLKWNGTFQLQNMGNEKSICQVIYHFRVHPPGNIPECHHFYFPAWYSTCKATAHNKGTINSTHPALLKTMWIRVCRSLFSQNSRHTLNPLPKLKEPAGWFFTTATRPELGPRLWKSWTRVKLHPSPSILSLQLHGIDVYHLLSCDLGEQETPPSFTSLIPEGSQVRNKMNLRDNSNTGGRVRAQNPKKW